MRGWRLSFKPGMLPRKLSAAIRGYSIRPSLSMHGYSIRPFLGLHGHSIRPSLICGHSTYHRPPLVRRAVFAGRRSGGAAIISVEEHRMSLHAVHVKPGATDVWVVEVQMPGGWAEGSMSQAIGQCVDHDNEGVWTVRCFTLPDMRVRLNADPFRLAYETSDIRSKLRADSTNGTLSKQWVGENFPHWPTETLNKLMMRGVTGEAGMVFCFCCYTDVTLLLPSCYTVVT
jgi:uncharacterized protein YbdZ (MbtH family)